MFLKFVQKIKLFYDNFLDMHTKKVTNSPFKYKTPAPQPNELLNHHLQSPTGSAYIPLNKTPSTYLENIQLEKFTVNVKITEFLAPQVPAVFVVDLPKKSPLVPSSEHKASPLFIIIALGVTLLFLRSGLNFS